MAELTREQLIEHAEAQITYLRAALEIQPDVGASEMLRLMEIALSALSTEPVAHIFSDPSGKLYHSIVSAENARHDDVYPVYRLPLLEGLK